MREEPFSIDAHLQQPVPEALYHYTSMEAAISIIKTPELWATDIFYLNDSSEYHKVVQAIRRRLDERIRNTTNTVELENLKTYQEVLVRGASGPIYVTSFSKVRDDLSQWRGYTPQGLGVCLGFRGGVVKDVVRKTYGAQLGRVIYINEKDDQSFDPMLDGIAALRPAGRHRLPRNIEAGLNAVRAAPFYKDATFENEREWRACLGGNLDLRNGQTIEFRAGRSTIVPYKVLDFDEYKNAMLSEVVIGPSPNIGLSVEGFKRLLAFHGLEAVGVEPSKVPFRPW